MPSCLGKFRKEAKFNPIISLTMAQRRSSCVLTFWHGFYGSTWLESQPLYMAACVCACVWEVWNNKHKNRNTYYLWGSSGVYDGTHRLLQGSTANPGLRARGTGSFTVEIPDWAVKIKKKKREEEEEENKYMHLILPAHLLRVSWPHAVSRAPYPVPPIPLSVPALSQSLPGWLVGTDFMTSSCNERKFFITWLWTRCQDR